MKTLFLISLLVVASFATEFDDFKPLWNAWKAQHKKFYSVSEDTARYAIFVDNYFKVQKFNSEHDTPRLGLNKFADLTANEFKELYTTRSVFEGHLPDPADSVEYVEEHPAPNDVDWRTKGVVTPVKNQGGCGSCWTFSTTGVLESFHAIKSGSLISFSEQQIVDCDNKDGNLGCDGGWPYLAVKYAATAGLETEKDYPYTGEDGSCKYKKSEALQVNKGYTNVTTKSVSALKTAITNQPVSVCIEADQDVFQMYTSGVIASGCGDAIDHAVLAVGYGTQEGQEAFIVKNSWGADWGDQGYVYISTSATPNEGYGVCGILMYPVIPN